MDQASANKTPPAKEVGQYGRGLRLIEPSLDDLLGDEEVAFDGRSLAGSDLRRARRVLEQLSDAAQHFVPQLDYQRLLVDVAAHAQRIIPSGQVIAYSNADGSLILEAQAPKSETLEQTVSADAHWCVRYLRPKVSNYSQPSADGIVGNSLCVPFVASQNRVLGVLEFRNKKTSTIFTDEDARVAICLARMATTALDRARLFFRIEEWRQSLETLLSFNATVNQHLDPEQMVRELVTNVTGFLDAEGGMAGIALRSDSGVELHCDGFLFADQWHAFSRTWSPGEGIPGTAFVTQFPYLSQDYKADPLREPWLCETFDLGSCICVPIKNPQEEVLGFFQLHRRTGGAEFTWQEAAFLESLGNTAAVAIENARLVKSLELKTEQVKSLSQNHVRRLEEERRHIARELHDETGQVLIGLKLRLQILSGLLTDEQSGVKTELAELRAQVNNAAVRLKDMAKRLRPPTLDELGFEATLRELVAEFRKNTSLAVQIDMGATPQLTSDEETALYRIVQECLTNVAKHANATRVEITFQRRDNHQILRIADDGTGFPAEEASKGLGHVGIRERVAMLGGKINVISNPGAGVAIEVILDDGDPA